MPRPVPAALLAAALALAPAALPAQEPFLSVATDEELGSYIVGPGGRPVYMFETAARGGDFLPPLESCGPRCRENWPPVFVNASTDLVVSEELDRDKTAVAVDAVNGERLVASYNDHPLFYYALEEGDGPSGHGIHTHGGWWIALAPDGEPIITGTIPDPAEY